MRTIERYEGSQAAIAHMRYILATVLSCACLTATGQPGAPFPDTLFGVKLGGIYKTGAPETTDVGTFPVKHFRGGNQFLGYGAHYYFEPVRHNDAAFKYVEKRKAPNDRFFETSFRLYLYPVFPRNVLQSKGVAADELSWEVALIEWSGTEEHKDDAYFWASDFCKTLEVDLGRKPDTFNDYDAKRYTCKFIENDTELEAHNTGDGMYFTLRYSRNVMDAKDAAAEAVYRKLQMNAIRPD